MTATAAPMLNPSNVLDQYIARFQNLPEFGIYAITANGSPVPWYNVTGETLVKDLAIREENLALAVQSVSVQIGHWGRLSALTKRIWEAEERALRVWKAKRYLEAVDPVGKPENWKKPTEAIMEAQYRIHPEYEAMEQRVERAEEAHNAATAALQAFIAKKDMLKSSVYRSPLDGQPRLSV